MRFQLILRNLSYVALLCNIMTPASAMINNVLQIILQLYLEEEKKKFYNFNVAKYEISCIRNIQITTNITNMLSV